MDVFLTGTGTNVCCLTVEDVTPDTSTAKLTGVPGVHAVAAR